MRRYDSYKDSGIEFLGDIPKKWEVKRIKDVIVKIGSGVTPKGGSETYVNDGITFLRSQNVYNDGLHINDVSFISKEVNDKMKNSQVKPLDILINITGASIGRTCSIPLSVSKANINQHIIYLRIKKQKIDYLSYYLKSPFVQDYIMSVQTGTSKEGLSMGQTLIIPISYPTNIEQTKIANYLDTKTKAIDKKTNLLEQKTQKYSELRKSIINKAVTKGLDANVKLKDSGIAWIGEIPEHWIVKRMKDVGGLYSGLSGKSGEDFNQEDNENNRGFLPFTNIASNTYIKTDDFGKVVIKNGEKQNRIKKNDLFFLMSSEGYEDIGKSSLLDVDVPETYLNSFCKGYRISNKQIEPKYLNWLLLSSTYRESLIIQGKGFTRINLKMDKINDFKIVIPPTITEQKQIAQFIDNKTTTIDSIVQNIEKQIEVLAELRKTLINDVVTGKLCVLNN